jgi:hypothetical protein
MLTSASGALVKQLNMVNKTLIFVSNAKFTSFLLTSLTIENSTDGDGTLITQYKHEKYKQTKRKR